ncbi:esterase-like activity of phytase family protein [Zhengella sp. ZM62]|uniref:esterase-like activity of phytase family protein n=1 Tax=Zhengella sedimenti TaxID=3390035 RepID=UPI003976CEF8
MRRARAIAALAALAMLSGTDEPAARDFDAAVTARPIHAFRIGSDENRFGPFTFVGGMSLSSGLSHFGSLSSFRFLDPGSRFLAVTDNGFWFGGRIERDGDGRPAGVSGGWMSEIMGPDGRPLGSKYQADAESLSIFGQTATVGFERYHRITSYRLDNGRPGPAGTSTDFIVPARELRTNRGFECVAHSPAEGMLGGGRVAVTEKSLDRNGNIFGAVLEGPRRGMFTVAKSGVYDITDCAFLPDGDLLLLERRYSLATGVGMQIRRIAGASIAKGAVLDGEILFSGGMEYQIDNMEGMDVWRAGDGTLRLSLVSDDNKSLLQRTLYLEFVIAE